MTGWRGEQRRHRDVEGAESRGIPGGSPCVRLAAIHGLSGTGTTMDRIRLRNRCARRVDALLSTVALPDPWDVDTFLDRLEQHRAREIDLCPVPWTFGDSTGAWQRADDHDVIAYPVNTSPLHQDHIILHEVGHLISEHRGRCVLSVQEAQQHAPDLHPAALAHLLDRPGSHTDEQEAEVIATLILARVARQRPGRPRRTPLDTRTETTLSRLTMAFDL